MLGKVVIFGAGPGLGKSLATEFAEKGHDLILIARNQNHLNEITNNLKGLDIAVETYTADVSDQSQFEKILKIINREKIDGFVYNVGITSPDKQLFMRDDLEHHFLTDVAGAYQAITTLRSNLAEQKGFALFTGGIAGVTPFPGYMGLSVSKAGMRSMVKLLHEEMSADGIFVGTVTISGNIKSGTHFSPDLIANEFVQLAQQRDNWEVKY